MNKVPQDCLETQVYELDTQVFQSALEPLDRDMPSPGVTFAAQKTLIMAPQDHETSQDVARDVEPSEEKITPSPKPKLLIEISPMKTSPTRDEQLGLKGAKEASKKAAAEAAKAAKEEKAKAKAAGGRGRGRGRGRGAKVTPKHHDDEGECEETEEEPATETEPVPEPKKSKGGLSKVEGSKNKGGRPKNAKAADAEADQPKRKSKQPKQPEPKAPPTRVRSKRKLEETPDPKPKPKPKSAAINPAKHDATTHQWPKTFARRYRPVNDSWMQRLWDGCVLAFADVIMPKMQPGQKTVLEARVPQSRIHASYYSLLQSDLVPAG